MVHPVGTSFVACLDVAERAQRDRVTIYIYGVVTGILVMGWVMARFLLIAIAVQ